MDEAEFDKFASEYRAMHAANITVSGESPEYFAEYKIVDIARDAAALGALPAQPRVLDFGAGVGYSVPFFARHLPSARITCLDVSQKSLEVGEAEHGARAEFTHFDGARIPYADATFDVALASCVFHHIPESEHVHLLGEIRRVLTPRGLLFVFEHNPLNPLTRHAVDTCPFDENAVLIRAANMRRRVLDAAFADAKINYRIFFPHALRGLRGLEPRLTWLPLGAQYYVRANK
jgi:ubiquinone/menaquinone biosynthesis C-methylase UbiE